MTLIITPDVIVDLMRLCLCWQWERGLERQKATHNREHPLYPTQVGWTTVDKIARVLCGLDLITKKQKTLLYKDRRLQYAVLHRTETATIGDFSLSRVLQESKKDFVLQCDAAESVNREKMLRDMCFYITESGRSKANTIAAKYATSITKEKYFAEIERQDSSLRGRPGAVETVMTRYRQKVSAETKG